MKVIPFCLPHDENVIRATRVHPEGSPPLPIRKIPTILFSHKYPKPLTADPIEVMIVGVLYKRTESGFLAFQEDPTTLLVAPIDSDLHVAVEHQGFSAPKSVQRPIAKGWTVLGEQPVDVFPGSTSAYVANEHEEGAGAAEPKVPGIVYVSREDVVRLAQNGKACRAIGLADVMDLSFARRNHRAGEVVNRELPRDDEDAEPCNDAAPKVMSSGGGPVSAMGAVYTANGVRAGQLVWTPTIGD